MAEQCFENAIKIIHDKVDPYAPKKRVVILSKHVIKEPWKTKGFMKSSKRKTSLYIKCLHKLLSHLDRFRYRHFNHLKTSTKQEYYHNKLDLQRSNIRQTWKV